MSFMRGTATAPLNAAPTKTRVRSAAIRQTLVTASLVFLGAQADAFAFSLETHLYVGSQVLEDVLGDGAISLCAGNPLAAAQDLDCNRQYSVPEAVVTALREQPGAYLAGTLGPDVYPDFITAQVTVHPGVDNGWQTDDWLEHLLGAVTNSQERAWVYGYLSHASADIFAHSWVNHYAGDIFDLKTHAEAGHEVELRHFILERYIADRTPQIWDQFAASRDAPHPFIADQLILSNAVASQYKRAPATGHLVAIETLHESVSRIHDDAVRLTTRIHEIALKEFSPLRAAEQMLHDAEVALQLAQDGVKAAQDVLSLRDRLIDEADKELLRLARIIDENPGIILGLRQQIALNQAALGATQASIGGLRDLVDSAQRELDRLNNILVNTGKNIEREVCHAVTKVLPPPLSNIVETVCEKVSDLNPAWAIAEANVRAAKVVLDGHKRVLEEAENRIRDLQNELVRLDGEVRDLEKAISDAQLAQGGVRLQIEAHRAQRVLEQNSLEEAQRVLAKTEEEIARIRAKVAELNGQLQPIADFLARYDPFILFLAHWREDIRKAMIAFSDTSEIVADRIVAKADGSRLDAYQDWFECWTPVLAAIPSEVSQTVCTARATFLAFKDKLDQEINNFVDQLGSFGWLLAPNVKIQQEFDKKVRRPLENEVRKELSKVRDEIVTFLSNRQLAELIRLMDSGEEITDNKLNGVYETDDSHSKLLEIADVASRVQRDAGLTSQGDSVSEDGFATLYNAIILSKIALLDAAGLNELHWTLTGKKGSVFLASGLYPTESTTVLLDAVRSIDGNHQWQSVALPYPRASGRDNAWPERRQYGREHPPGQSGFRLWGDLEARSAIFRRIFKGPLNPGIEDHPIYSVAYPFPACAANPFPSTKNSSGALNRDGDMTCRMLSLSATSGQPGRFGALSTESLSRRDLVGLAPWDLRIARNEVFARHGYSFGPPELVAYFAAQPWYRSSGLPARQVNELLTKLEWRNVMLIRRLEQDKPLGRPPLAIASR